MMAAELYQKALAGYEASLMVRVLIKKNPGWSVTWIPSFMSKYLLNLSNTQRDKHLRILYNILTRLAYISPNVPNEVYQELLPNRWTKK